jgi:hypothetical protein
MICPSAICFWGHLLPWVSPKKIDTQFIISLVGLLFSLCGVYYIRGREMPFLGVLNITTSGGFLK